MSTRPFRCPFCGHSRFERFFTSLGEYESIRLLSDEQLIELIKKMHEKRQEPYITLTCSHCKAPVRLAKEDHVAEIMFFIRDEELDEQT